MIQNLPLALSDLLEWLPETEYVAIDTETNAEDIRDGRGFATGLSIALEREGIIYASYFPVRHVTLDTNEYDPANISHEDLNKFKECIEAYNGWVVFHNAGFDLVSLSTLGITYTGKFYCTMIMAHLINENWPYAKSLNACVAAYVSKDEAKQEAELDAAVRAFGWARVPIATMIPYAVYDSVLTLTLYKKLRRSFEAENLSEIWDHKQDLIRTIIKMENYGILINRELCTQQVSIGKEVLWDLSTELQGNLGSPVFLKKLLLDELKLPVVKVSPKTGKPSFDKEAMEQYDEILERVDDHTAKLIQQYRGWQKAITSNYEAYLNLVSPDGRLRPNYKLHGTVTGRASCSEPNLQQIPRVSNKEWNGNMKKAFIAAEDFELWEFDYKQLELRLATGYAQNPILLKVFEEGRDIFSEMAVDLSLSRQDTKTFVYSVQYGAGNTRISNVFKISMNEAAKLRQRYADAYPEFTHLSLQAAKICMTKGKIKLWSGRYRHFKDRKEDAHKAFNSVIQGGAADIVERVMVRLSKEIDCKDCRMLLQVHDSVVFEIRSNEVDKYKEKILAIMEDIKPDFGVKFAVDAHKWGE